MSPEFWYGLVAGFVALLLHQWVRKDAVQRHARWKMRARLAQWLLEDKLQPVRAKKGKVVLPLRKSRRVDKAQRRSGLSVVRREDSSSGAA
jgi:hypothetical protein